MIRTARSTSWLVLVLFTAVSFTWSERLSAVGILLLLLHWLIDRRLFTKLASFRLQTATLLFWGFILLHILLLWRCPLDEDGVHSIEVKLSFFILPLLFSTENYLNAKRVYALFLVFAISCCMSFIYTFGHSCLVNSSSGWRAVIGRMNVSEAIMHPGYYSNYFAYSLVWLVLEWRTNKPGTIWLKGLYGLILFIHAVAILLLISKTALIFLGLFLIYYCWLISRKAAKRTMQIFIFALFLLFSFGIVWLIPNVRDRVHDMENNTRTMDKEMPLSNSTGSRLVAWRSEWTLIRKNPLYGYGTGRANSVLGLQLKREGYRRLWREHMHTHNQLLHTWLDLGLAGPLLLLALLGYSAFYFLRTRQILGFWMAPLILINILTDDMLEIQAGTVFFIYFLTLLIYKKTEEQPLTQDALNL